MSQARPGRGPYVVMTAALACASLAACSTAAEKATGPATSASPLPAATATPSPGPSAACSNAQVVATWPLSRRVAQLVVVPVLNFDVEGAAADVRDGAGGLLFLGSAAPPSDLAARLHTVLARAGAGGAPLVMADEEGGGVQRLAPAVSVIPWARQMAQTMSVAQVQALASRAGQQMTDLGISVDLAPVLDVDAGPGPSASNPDGARSFSGDASVAARYGIAFMNGLAAARVLPVVKHFPGLGGASGNTDVGPARTEPITSLTKTGLVPFRAAVRAGAPAVMVSNATVPGVTARPASLSSNVIGGLLRRQLGFHGLVLTDSLSAGAVSRFTGSLSRSAVDAVAAGADMVLFGSTLTSAETALLSPANVHRSFTSIDQALTAAVAAGTIPVGTVNAAVTAVLAAKHVDLCR